MESRKGAETYKKDGSGLDHSGREGEKRMDPGYILGVPFSTILGDMSVVRQEESRPTLAHLVETPHVKGALYEAVSTREKHALGVWLGGLEGLSVPLGAVP